MKLHILNVKFIDLKILVDMPDLTQITTPKGKFQPSPNLGVLNLFSNWLDM